MEDLEDLWKNIPTFPQFRELVLEDKPLFHVFFSQFPPVISEYTFTNLFMWHHAYKIKMSRLQNFPCILADRREDPFFFPVIGEGDVIQCYQGLPLDWSVC